ncbi:hypothetical protein C1645_811899 [Glomus cerebriforme]|uniref:Crinkler effector protein N-terminal domain-containing protein n=1 Tax=Glomus cerebriforme TaxID=658196 RepID=A0A397TMH4_9GLOM|nr:hypothetical protein C1645_811899 [Glomus cerebriforme]
MSITLLCLIKENTTASAFAIDIDRKKLVNHLKKAIKAEKVLEFNNFPADKLKLWKVTIPDDCDDLLSNPTLQDKLLATRDIEEYWPEKPPKRHIHVIIKLPLLSLEEALSCILPPITYFLDCVTLKTTTKASGDTLAKVIDEEDVRSILDFNICQILNKLMGPDCIYSRKSTDTPGILDFNCHLVGSLILVIEAKRKHVLEDMEKQTFPEFYQTSKDKDVSESPSVLKTYAYLTQRVKENPKSPKPQVVVLVQGDNNSHNLWSHSKSSSSSSLNNQTSSNSTNQQSSSAFSASNNPL